QSTSVQPLNLPLALGIVMAEAPGSLCHRCLSTPHLLSRNTDRLGSTNHCDQGDCSCAYRGSPVQQAVYYDLSELHRRSYPSLVTTPDYCCLSSPETQPYQLLPRPP